MRKLSLTVPYVEGESPLSFASRLSARNFCGHMREFGADMDISISALIDGDHDTVVRLAELGGADPQVVLRSTLVREKELMFRLNSAVLSKQMLQRMIPKVCPICAAEDIEHSSLAPHLAIAGRTIWQVSPIFGCLRHLTAIEDLGVRHWPGYAHDFAYYIKSEVPRISEMAREAAVTAPTPDQAYLARRLEHDFVGDDQWPDILSFTAAAKLFQVVGTVKEFGRKASIEKLVPAELARASAAGYEVCRNGYEGYRDFLVSLQYWDSRSGTARAQAMFGGIHRWLSTRVAEETDDLAPIADFTREVIAQTMPVAEGDVIFGKPVARRYVHSAYSSAKAVGIHVKTARKALSAGGFISADQQDLIDHNVRVDADKAETFLRRYSEGIPGREIQNYLNASRPLEHLLTSQYLQPVVVADEMEPRYHPSDLDAFFRCITAGAAEVIAPLPHQVSIVDASRKATCSVAEVMTCLFNGRLQWRGQLKGVGGMRGILVDADEVKRLVVLTDVPPGMTPTDFADKIGVPRSAARRLVADGHLVSTKVRHPVNRHWVPWISEDEFARFSAHYISLRDLATLRGIWWRHLQAELADQGIRPVGGWDEFGAHVYDRSLVT